MVVTLNKKAIYIAGPLFSIAEKQFLIKFVDEIATKLNLDPINHFFLPHRDAGDLGIINGREDIFKSDLDHLNKAEIVIAVLEGADVDSGTAVEIGYAFAKNKKIFGFLTDIRAYGNSREIQKLNNMVWGICNEGKSIFHNIDDLCNNIKSEINL